MGVSRGIDKRYEANIRPREERKESWSLERGLNVMARINLAGSKLQLGRTHAKEELASQYTLMRLSTWREIHSLGASTEVLSLPLDCSENEREREGGRGEGREGDKNRRGAGEHACRMIIEGDEGREQV